MPSTAPHVLILLALIAVLAYVLKGVTGFGPSIIIVALGSLILPTHAMVVLSAILNAVAGLILLLADPIQGRMRFWLPLAAAMTVGSVAGGLYVSIILPRLFNIIVGTVVALLALWFFFSRAGRAKADLEADLPARSSPLDLAVATFAGVLGGLTGIGGPPMVWYFGHRFSKRAFRQAVVPVFLLASVARIGTYWATGLIDVRIISYALASLPGLLLGVFLGNRAFFRISELTFSRAVGTVLMIVAVRLVIR